MPEERATITVTEAARLLGVSRSLAFEAVARGEIPSLKIGRRIVVSKKALEDLLESGRQIPSVSGNGSTRADGSAPTPDQKADARRRSQ